MIMNEKEYKDKMSEVATRIISQNLENDCDFLDKILVDFTKDDDVVIYGIIHQSVGGVELECIEKTLLNAKSFLKYISPIFDNKNIRTSLYTKEKYKKHKGLEEDVRVVHTLKKFVNEETILNLKKLNEILSESRSKRNILVDKLGLNPGIADFYDRLCGSFSVWMVNKIFEHYKNEIVLVKVGLTPKDIPNGFWTKQSQKITQIMDYIRVGLGGNNKSIKNLSFDELVRVSKEWHDSLEVGQGQVNYEETHPIIVDFRNKDGIGFYWADLETNSSDEECERMGHCGRTGYGNNLYSLREVIKIPNTKYTINKSHLTSSISSNGTLLQMKGPKNSKPKEEYHKYILPLFTKVLTDPDGDTVGHLINDFGREYASEKDFKLEDLSEEQIKILYEKRPELFSSRRLKKLLNSYGIIELPKKNYVFEIQIDADNINDYVEGDYVVRQGKRKDGSSYKTYFFETLLAGDMWDIWDSSYYYSEGWKSALEYSCNNKNEKRILEIVKSMAGEDFDEELSLQEMIEEYDSNNEIQSALGSAQSDCEADGYHDYLYKTLKECLEEYGIVEYLNDTGTKIKINLSNYLDDIGEDYLEELEEACSDDPSCMFTEMVYQGDIDKPKYSVDERYNPDCDNDNFNEILSDRLGEIFI
jgi:hypothetical protein